ncbi:unknown [Eubacterium sp. CAG:786]|nr:unknown [Eubacterium sp. CAG:786]
MGDIHVGDKVVVRLKEYFSGEGSVRPLVQGVVMFVNTTANFAVIDVGNYRVSYWLNEIAAYNENEFEYTYRNRVKRTSVSTAPEDEEIQPEA